MLSARLYLGIWYPWYAWRPVKVEGRWVWLKRIERCIEARGGRYLSSFRLTP
jgi:hypothetical protein